MKNIYELPVAENVCNQILREVVRNDSWSLAHVVMNPREESLLHEHQVMTEIYVITKGRGDLIQQGLRVQEVEPGDMIVILPNTPHKLINTGLTSLEHIVVANPPFIPSDVHELKNSLRWPRGTRFPPHELVDFFVDGGRGVARRYEDLKISHALGWVMNNPKKVKPPHYHRETTEYILVVEGDGGIELNSEHREIKAGDWIEIPPFTSHALRNENSRHMVVLCTCYPAFREDDVFWDCAV